jgi:predicted DNA-binding transcriptional regulator AlpA
MDQQVKAAITVSEMCKLLKMSRTQFYDHVKRGTFHAPLRLGNGRPFFNASQVQENINTKEIGVGVNGEFVIFYNRKAPPTDTHYQGARKKPPKKAFSDLLARLNQLGLSPTTQQVEDAVAECYPQGFGNDDENEVLRTIFRHLKASGTA